MKKLPWQQYVEFKAADINDCIVLSAQEDGVWDSRNPDPLKEINYSIDGLEALTDEIRDAVEIGDHEEIHWAIMRLLAGGIATLKGFEARTGIGE